MVRRTREGDDEYLKVDQFVTLEDARVKIEAWRHDYNRNRPHSSPRNLIPHEFARQGQLMTTGEGNDFWL